MTIQVLKPGLFSTFQDLGRKRYQHLGVPINGAMDERAHRLANWILGNAAGEATLEITLLGPTLLFNRSAVIAISGADLSPSLNREPIPLNTAITVPANSTLSFGTRKSGLRAYLAIQGGYELDIVMGSTSTYVRGSYGGLNGTALKKGQIIPLTENINQHLTRTLPAAPIFGYGVVQGANSALRIVPGREYDSFLPKSISAIGRETYHVSPQSDRMGYRLTGPTLMRQDRQEMLSEAVTMGTIQVPPDGLPIVLMADAQTTGGYPRIAHLAWVDIPRLAQRTPGDSLTFEWISLHEAQRLAIEQAKIFANMESAGLLHPAASKQ